MKVLLVDDDAIWRLVLEHLMTNMGMRVETAESVDGAIAALSQSLFDLIVCDHLMPERTGLDLLDELAGCPTPFVLLIDETDRRHGDPHEGAPYETDRRLAYRRPGDGRVSGASACLSKPVSDRDLRKLIDELVTSPTL